MSEESVQASGQGPLFMTSVTAGGIGRVEVAGEADHAELELVRAMVAIHQMALDQLYGTATAKACGSCLFDGRGWLTSAYFPGASPLPADAAVVHSIGINATVPRQWGRRAAHYHVRMYCITMQYSCSTSMYSRYPPGLSTRVQCRSTY